MHQQQTFFENLVGKGEIARNELFLLFPQYSRLNQILIVSPFVYIFDIMYFFASELEESKIGISGRGLKLTWTNAFNLEKANFLYARRRPNVLWDHPWLAGGQRPPFFVQSISPKLK